MATAADSGPDVAEVTDAAAAVADVVVADGACGDAASPPPLLPLPTGSYGIGRSARRTLVDPVRDEPETPDPTDKRKLSIEIWYPTAACETGGSAAPYLDPAEAEYFTRLKIAGPRTHARTGVPMVADGKRHPVLLFSSGYGLIPRVYSLFYEELVSQGYVVVTIAHTYWDALTTFADGTTVQKTKGFMTNAEADAELGVWIDDTTLVLDSLAGFDANDVDGTLTGRLDLDKIGALGHSFGGATAIRLTASDPRTKVGVNLDGSIFGIGADEGDAGLADADADAASGDAGMAPTIANPFLIFRSDRGDDPTFPPVLTRATGPAYELLLTGSVHGSFSDIPPLNERHTGAVDPTFGTIDSLRATHVINAYLVAFFAQHLLGGGAQPLLAGPSATYPEIVFQHR